MHSERYSAHVFSCRSFYVLLTVLVIGFATARSVRSESLPSKIKSQNSSAAQESDPQPELESDQTKTGLISPVVMLESSQELDFIPLESSVVAGFDTGDIISVAAVAVPPQKVAKNLSDLSRWWISSPVRIPVGARHVTWVGRIVAPSGLVTVTSAQTRSLSELDGVSQLRAEVTQLSVQAALANKELISLEREMTRLRGEAELIGNFGRIIDAQEEQNRVEGELAQLADQSLSVEQFLAKAQNFAAPSSAAVREQQLVKEISDIAEAAQDVERHELLRRAKSERDVKRMMAALDAARAPGAEQPGYKQRLSSELSRLISLREQLELAHQ